MENTNTKKKTNIEEWHRMMDEYDRELAESRRRTGRPEKNQPEECMDELLVEYDVKHIYEAMCEHKSLKRALEDYPHQMTAEEFKKNVVWVMKFQSWKSFEGECGSYLDA
ncbi:MAG: hypothetical protein IJK84_00445 [Bacteroidales bacterium]|nr:hypothetical protein [Bacteroidales bacterium]